jgi:hypothetical protein
MDPAKVRRLLSEIHADGKSAAGAGEQLCRVCEDQVAVDGAGIMLVDNEGDLSAFGVSNDLVRRLEDLQFTLGEGPGIEAHATARLVWEPELDGAATMRWSAYGPAAGTEGVAAVFALPLRVGGVGLGALDLYRRTPGALDAQQLTDAMVLADAAVELLLSLQASAAFGGTPVGIELAGGLRARVHQAAGMISERLQIPIGDALVRLRGYAYAAGRPIDDVAREIIERRLRIDEPPE